MASANHQPVSPQQADTLSFVRIIVSGSCRLKCKVSYNPEARKKIKRDKSAKSGQISSPLDVGAVKQFLGDAQRKFETVSITTVIRIKAEQQLPAAA
jgi:hypothetical protein